MTTKTKDVCIIGAGITGCTIARLLAEQDYNVTIYESHYDIGGACKDVIEDDGTYIQYHGSHIFHTNNEKVWKFLSRFTRWLPYQHKVKALINGDLVPVPFNLNSLKSLNDRFVEDIYDSLKSYQYGKEFTLEELTNSNDMTLRALGTYIYENVFKTYSTKQWGKIPEKSTLNRVKAFRFSKDNRYFLDKYQGIPRFGFLDMMEEILGHENITVRTNQTRNLPLLKAYSLVVYTGPIDELFNYQLGELPYRTCDFYKSNYSYEKTQEAAVINYPNDYDFTRVHDYSWYKPSRNSCVSVEVPKQFDKDDKSQVRYYPIESKENKELYNEYLKLAFKELPNTIFAGRLGTYKYLNMDKAIEQAFEKVELILNQT